MKKNKQLLNNNLIADINPQSAISEQYRTLRTTIEFMMSDKGLKSVLVTSPEAGAGKSTTVGNLAVTFAQQGKKVLLIDADLRKPAIHTFFRIMNRRGLTNVLSKQNSFDESFQRTKIADNLSILTSGPIPPNPSELVGSLAMQNLIVSVSQNFDVVLIDTPPVLAVTDAQVLSRLADGTIIVVHANQTGKKELSRVKKLLNQVQANVLGVILHGVDMEQSDYYYY